MGNEHSQAQEPVKTVYKPQVQEHSRSYDPRYGQIRYVVDTNTNKKMILKDVVTNSKEDFEKELAFYEKRSKYSHPNIIMIYGYTLHDIQNFCATYFRVSLYIEITDQTLEQDLDTHIEQQNLYPEIEILLMAENLISALSHLQTLDRHHGDIHPKNIFIAENNVYKLSDPTISLNKENGLATAILGIAKPFLSPQLVDQVLVKDFELKCDPYKADVFSLGICLLSFASLTKSEDLYNYDTCKIDMELVFYRLEAVKKNYSSFTYELIRDMLIISEAERPDFVALQNRLLPYEDDIKNRIELPFFRLRDNYFEDFGSQTTKMFDIEKYTYEEKENPILQDFIQSQLNTHAKCTARKFDSHSEYQPNPPSEVEDDENLQDMYYMGDIDGAQDDEMDHKHNVPQTYDQFANVVATKSLIVHEETPFQVPKGNQGSFVGLQASQQIEINDCDSYTNLRPLIDGIEKPNLVYSGLNFTYEKPDYTTDDILMKKDKNAEPPASNMIKSDDLIELDQKIKAALQRSEQTFKKLIDVKSSTASVTVADSPASNFLSSTQPSNLNVRLSYDQINFKTTPNEEIKKPLSTSDTFIFKNLSNYQPSLNYHPIETQNTSSPTAVESQRLNTNNTTNVSNTEPAEINFNDPNDLNKFLDQILSRSQNLVQASQNITSNLGTTFPEKIISPKSKFTGYNFENSPIPEQKVYSLPTNTNQSSSETNFYIFGQGTTYKL